MPHVACALDHGTRSMLRSKCVKGLTHRLHARSVVGAVTSCDKVQPDRHAQADRHKYNFMIMMTIHKLAVLCTQTGGPLAARPPLVCAAAARAAARGAAETVGRRQPAGRLCCNPAVSSLSLFARPPGAPLMCLPWLYLGLCFCSCDDGDPVRPGESPSSVSPYLCYQRSLMSSVIPTKNISKNSIMLVRRPRHIGAGSRAGNVPWRRLV